MWRGVAWRGVARGLHANDKAATMSDLSTRRRALSKLGDSHSSSLVLKVSSPPFHNVIKYMRFMFEFAKELSTNTTSLFWEDGIFFSIIFSKLSVKLH